MRKYFIWSFPYMLVGYMRVSSESDRQTTDPQRDSLLAAGVDERHLFKDKASGARDDRPGLAKAHEFVRNGDCLVVWKFDCLGRSLSHLLTMVTGLKEKGVALALGGEKGYDAGKKIQGHKRPLLVDTLGLLRVVVVTAASVQDRGGAKRVLQRLRGSCKKLRRVWVAGGYRGTLLTWVSERFRLVFEGVLRSEGAQGFQ